MTDDQDRVLAREERLQRAVGRVRRVPPAPCPQLTEDEAERRLEALASRVQVLRRDTGEQPC